MKALFCVFSGTGNTRRVAERLSEELRALGHEVDVVSIRMDGPAPDVLSYGVLLVGYPVHAFNAPTPVLRFLKSLPKAAGMPVYLVRTSGEPSKVNDASGITPKRILKRRGYRVTGEFSYVMPYNIIFRHSDSMAVRMWRAAERRAARDAETISAGGGTLKKVNPLRRLTAFLCRIEHPAMPAIGRTFRVDKKKCLGCGSCVTVCPRGNITMKDGKPHFGGHCIGCMACSFGCPKDAIRISILNGWRVNGAYSFEGEPATDGEVCRYCRKMYVRYFHESEEE